MKLSGHRPPLDGVRGTAALMVLIGHLGNRELFLVPGVAHDLLGKPGVWLFFALSAFLLTARLTEDLEESSDPGGALLTYALNRVFRIFPLYLLVMATHWAIGDFADVIASGKLWRLLSWRELWAIPVELQYYLVIPFIAVFAARFGRTRAIRLMWAALALAFVYNLATPAFLFQDSGFIHAKLVPFFAGSLAGLLALERGEPAPATAWRRAVLPALAALGFALSTQGYRELSLGPDLPFRVAIPTDSLALGGFGAALISLSLEPNWLGRVTSSAPLVFYGRVSFSLYLWHEPIITHARALGLEVASPVARAWLFIAVSTLAAWLSYRVIERPGMELGRRLGRALRARRLAVA